MRALNNCVTFYRRVGDVEVLNRDQGSCGRHGIGVFEALARCKARHRAPHKQSTNEGLNFRACIGLFTEICNCTRPVTLSCAADPCQLRLAFPSCVLRDVSDSVSCVALVPLMLAKRPICHGNEAFLSPEGTAIYSRTSKGGIDSEESGR